MASDPMVARRSGKKLPMEDISFCQCPLQGAEQVGNQRVLSKFLFVCFLMPDCVAVWALWNFRWTWWGWSCQSCQQVSHLLVYLCMIMHDMDLANFNGTRLLFEFLCFNILICKCKTDVFTFGF